MPQQFAGGRATRVFTLALILTAVALADPRGAGAQAPDGRTWKQRLLDNDAVISATAIDALKAKRAFMRESAPRDENGAPLPPPDIVPGMIAVRFDETLSTRARSSLAAAVQATRVSTPAWANFSVIHLPEDADPREAAAALTGRPGVVFAEPVATRHKHYRPNDPFLEYQWNLEAIGMERAWDINRGGASSVIVAVIDSGVAYKTEGVIVQAPDLAGTTFVAGRDFIWDDDEPVDLDGHGTHVTGTVAQTTNNGVGVAGIAFNVSVMPIKALSGEIDELLGAPNRGTSVVLAQAIRFAADNGAKVINMSLGGSAGSTAEREAIEYAVEKGVVLVASAGNEGEEGSPAQYPAAYAKDVDGFLAVGALDIQNQRSFFSNVNDYVEISAPGGDLRFDRNGDGFADGVLQQTLDPDAVEQLIFDDFGYFFRQGTSMASPHVAALAALLVDQGVTSPKGVEGAIKKFATDVGPAGRDDETGAGIITPRATLRGLGLRR